MTACDFSVALRIVASDGSTVVFDFNNRVAGYTVESYQDPDDATRKIRVTAPRVDGDVTVAEADDAGDFTAIVRVDGASWVECDQRWEAARAAYRAETFYYLELVVEGVTRRWRTERPDVSSAGTESVNLLRKQKTYSVVWHVQPNPTISYA